MGFLMSVLLGIRVRKDTSDNLVSTLLIFLPLRLYKVILNRFLFPPRSPSCIKMLHDGTSVPSYTSCTSFSPSSFSASQQCCVHYLAASSSSELRNTTQDANCVTGSDNDSTTRLFCIVYMHKEFSKSVCSCYKLTSFLLSNTAGNAGFETREAFSLLKKKKNPEVVTQHFVQYLHIRNTREKLWSCCCI